MAAYKLFLWRDGELVGEVKRHCADVLDALDAARGLCRDHMVEVYADARLVGRVKQGDKPLTLNHPLGHLLQQFRGMAAEARRDAARADSPEMQAAYAQLAKSWEELLGEIERG